MGNVISTTGNFFDSVADIARAHGIMQRDPDAIGSLGQRQVAKNVNIYDYLRISDTSNNADGVTLELLEEQRRQRDELKSKGQYSQISDIDWQTIEEGFEVLISSDREQSVEKVAANYALQSARLQNSAWNAAEKELSQARLDEIYTSTKNALGSEMTDELHAFLRSGNVNVNYAGLRGAINIIVDNRAEEYGALLHLAIQNDELRLNYSVDRLVAYMYKTSNVNIRKANDKEIITEGKQYFTYGEIKGMFSAMKYITDSVFKATEDPQSSFSGQSSKWSLVQSLGVDGAAYSLLANRYSQGALSNDINSALIVKLERAAKRLSVDPNEVLNAFASFSLLPLDTDNFITAFAKTVALYGYKGQNNPGDMPIIKQWNEFVETVNSIDAGKYHIGYDKYI